jgi:tetratricopeptide (TPR) repeat protein
MADLYSDNTDWQRSLGDAFNRIGRAQLMAGDQQAALKAFEEAREVARKLGAADAGNAEWQRDLMVVLRNIGAVLADIDDLTGAASMVEESLAVARKLATADPTSAQAQIDVAEALHKIGYLLATDEAKSSTALREALAIVEQLERADKLPPVRKSWPDELRVLVSTAP